MYVHSYLPDNFSWKPSKPVTDKQIIEHMKAKGRIDLVTVALPDYRYDLCLQSGNKLNAVRYDEVARAWVA